MSNPIDPAKLASFDRAYHILKNRYPDAQEKEFDWWLSENTYDLQRYDHRGEPCDTGTYYERSIIESFDFYSKTHLLVKRVLRSEIEGNIISGLEAAKRIRKGYIKNPYTHPDFTLEQSLGSLMSFKNNALTENDMLIINNEILANHVTLFYSENEVNDFNLYSHPEYQYISYDELIKIKEFCGLDEEGLIHFLLDKNRNKLADLKFPILAASHEVLRKFFLRIGLLQ